VKLAIFHLEFGNPCGSRGDQFLALAVSPVYSFRMQEPQAAVPSTASASFASVLAALARPAQENEADWVDRDLEDDMATISYEQALRSQARFRPADPDQGSTMQDLPISRPHSTSGRPVPERKDRKAASITIRLSEAECAQVRQRATDAGLTMSAYLRSCVLEAEILREQVKEALTQFRSVSPTVAEVQDRKYLRTRSWRARLFSRWSHGPQATDA
jgi:hypothetical protein